MQLKMSSWPFCPGWGELTWIQKSMHCLFVCCFLFFIVIKYIWVMLSELKTGQLRQSLYIWHIGYDTEMSKKSFCFSAYNFCPLYCLKISFLYVSVPTYRMNFSYIGKMLSDDVTQVVSSVRSFEHIGTVAYFENHKRCECRITVSWSLSKISIVRLQCLLNILAPFLYGNIRSFAY